MRLTLLLMCAVALAACSGKPPAPQATAERPAGPEAPWQHLQKDQQRAQAVQQTVDQQAAEQRRQIEAAQQ